MIIYPAIDIQGGKCVRLKKGDFNEVTEFNPDVLDQAKKFEKAGFEWLHVVDLDGAKKGRPINLELITKIINETSLKVQVGGGIRGMNSIDKLVNVGAERIILGTAAIKNFDLVKEACSKYPGKIAVGLDARGNKVAIRGWQEETDIYIFDLIEKLENIGVAAIIYTDIERDGLLAGVDEQGTKEIAKSISIPIIASGGVSSVADLQGLKDAESTGVSGVIVGRAFYEEKISFSEALTFC